MKVAIYSPYLDTYGGGERYMLTIAECLVQDRQVDLLLDQHLLSLGQQHLKRNLSNRLNIDLTKVDFIKAPIGAGSNFFQRIKFLRQYDYLFYLTDGSIFYSTAKNNILHFQVPFKNIVAKGVWGTRKLSTWKLAIYNSKFTKEIVEQTWAIKGQLIYPPVDIDSFKTQNKKPIILSVGRFFDFLHSKKQDILVRSFANLVKQGVTGWKLQLAGGTNQAGTEFLKKIKVLAKGLPIEIYPDVSFRELTKLYGEASIYWHGAGYGEKDPTKMEHFGITTVEAMAAGCVPVVINGGGQPEIVENGKSGYLWSDPEELKKFTLQLTNDVSLLRKLSQNAILRSKIFSKERFCKKIGEIISG